MSEEPLPTVAELRAVIKGSGAYRRSWRWMYAALAAGLLAWPVTGLLGWPVWTSWVAQIVCMGALRQEGYWTGYDKGWRSR
jgi:hypothetical protein